MWDVIVVGAGPAGCAAALSALATREDASVLLLDRAAFPRDKPCGDGLSPQALDVLTSVGLTGVVDDYRPVHQLCLGYPGGGEVSGQMSRPSRVVPRAVLDARLLAATLARGATFVRHTVRTVEGRRDRVVVDGQWAARVVVAADGAQSVLRRQMGLGRAAPGHLALAIRGYAPHAAELCEGQRIVFDRGDWPAYAWSFPIGDGTANVGYGRVLRGTEPLTREHLMREMDRLLPGITKDTVRWRAHHLPLASARARQPNGRLLLVGDACGLVNPLSGEGIFAAVASGALAGAAALGPGDPGASYRRAVHDRLGHHLRHSALARALACRPVWVDAVLAATRSDAVVFDNVVALSLGGGTLTLRTMLAILAARLDTVGAAR